MFVKFTYRKVKMVSKDFHFEDGQWDSILLRIFILFMFKFVHENFNSRMNLLNDLFNNSCIIDPDFLLKFLMADF